MNIKELNQKIQKDEDEKQALQAKVEDLTNKIDKLKVELADTERKKADLESKQNPEDVKKAQPEIEKLNTKIEELKTDISNKDIQLNEYNDQLQEIQKSLEESKKQLAEEQEKLQKKQEELQRKKEEAKGNISLEERSVKPFSVNEGDYVFHWCYGPMQVNRIDKYIHCTIVDPDGIANVASGKFRTGEVKKFPLDAPGKWLFKDSTDIMNSAFFAPTLRHESFAG